jgi:hypothetical protein
MLNVYRLLEAPVCGNLVSLAEPLANEYIGCSFCVIPSALCVGRLDSAPAWSVAVTVVGDIPGLAVEEGNNVSAELSEIIEDALDGPCSIVSPELRLLTESLQVPDVT